LTEKEATLAALRADIEEHKAIHQDLMNKLLRQSERNDALVEEVVQLKTLSSSSSSSSSSGKGDASIIASLELDLVDISKQLHQSEDRASALHEQLDQVKSQLAEALKHSNGSPSSSSSNDGDSSALSKALEKIMALEAQIGALVVQQQQQQQQSGDSAKLYTQEDMASLVQQVNEAQEQIEQYENTIAQAKGPSNRSMNPPTPPSSYMNVYLYIYI